MHQRDPGEIASWLQKSKAKLDCDFDELPHPLVIRPNPMAHGATPRSDFLYFQPSPAQCSLGSPSSWAALSAMSLFRCGDVWWCEFWFARRRIQGSSESPSKTIARNAEQKRRRELEEGFNNFTDTRRKRVRTFSDVADEFFNSSMLRLRNSAVFDYAIDHLKRLLPASSRRNTARRCASDMRH